MVVEFVMACSGFAHTTRCTFALSNDGLLTISRMFPSPRLGIVDVGQEIRSYASEHERSATALPARCSSEKAGVCSYCCYAPRREFSMSEPHYRDYWRALYPECAQSAMHWYPKWKAVEMSMGLFDERQGARHRWISTGPRGGREESHETAVVTYRASPVRSLTARVCLSCSWVSADLDEEHSALPESAK
jgi:hypothetical protein